MWYSFVRCVFEFQFAYMLLGIKLRDRASSQKCFTMMPIIRKRIILNGKPLETVDCFIYLGSQVASNEGCERDEVH